MTKTISPDDQMTKPLESLLFSAACMTDPPCIYPIESEIAHACQVALRLRSKEVVDYAAEHGLFITIEQVQKSPLNIAEQIIMQGD